MKLFSTRYKKCSEGRVVCLLPGFKHAARVGEELIEGGETFTHHVSHKDKNNISRTEKLYLVTVI